MIRIYGIKNCDTMKKAFAWCDSNGISYEFHDYKKLGVPRERLLQWCRTLGWKTLINSKGPTWRKLTPEQQAVTTQSQAVALEAMYQEISSTRDERLLAEVEQAVVIAMQQLQFAGNVEAALIALQGAEARLARAVQPQFLPVRKLIVRDIERLKGTPGANISGLSLKIESVVAAVDGLPLAYEQRPKAETAKPAAAKPASVDYWRDLGADLWRELRQLVRIERIDQGDPALLSPNQSFFLRENLKLRLLNARLALLQRDGKVFREEIRQSREHLDRYFDGRAKPVQAAQATLKALAATDVSFDLPGLAETLTALRNLKFPRDRAAGPGSGARSARCTPCGAPRR